MTKSEALQLPWQSVGTKNMPNKSAVYMLTNQFTGEIEYIGQCVNLRYRLKHNHPVFIPGVHRVNVLWLQKKSDREYYEYALIDTLRPSQNKRGGRCKSYSDKFLDEQYHSIFDACDN